MEQPDFIYFECSSCEFSSVQHSTFKGGSYCPICAEDNGRDVVMTQRVCRDTDKPEGRDARKP
jgi:hypothetical protein